MSEMMPLQTQEQFEILLGRVSTDKPIPPVVVVYFTATWCKACKRLNLDEVQASAPTATWMKCDIDQNEYTYGYCGLRSIPTFLVVKEKKVLSQLSDSRTEKVVDWLKSLSL